MKFVECKYEEVINIERRKPKAQLYEALVEFTNSGIKCVKIEEHGYKRANACAKAFNEAAKRFNINSVMAITRKGECYLINTVIK